MKKLAFLVCYTLIAAYSLNGQSFQIEKKSITGIFDAQEKNKSELFSSINKWISINYHSAKNVIQMNELESGTIIVKGINEISYKNPSKQLYPNIKSMPEISTVNFNHLLEINIKDNKYRIIFTVTGVESQGYNSLFLDCICLNDTIDNNSLLEYNQDVDKQLKAGPISKEKRDKFMALSLPMFQEINSNLRNDIKITMLSIQKSILKSYDNW